VSAISTLLGSGPLGPRKSAEGSALGAGAVFAAAAGGTGGAVCVSADACSACGVSCIGCAAAGGTAIMAAAAIANGGRKDFMR
jgi:hypothetical protein